MFNKKFKQKIAMALLSVTMIGFSYVAWNNDYMSEKEYEVTLIDKFETVGYKGGSDFYGIFKLKDGTIFSNNLSVVDYRMFEINKQYIRELRPFDIKQTESKNTIYFLGTVVVTAATLTLVIATLGFLFL